MRFFRPASTTRAKALSLALALLFGLPSSLAARPLPPQQTPQTTKQKQLPPAQYIPSRNYDTRNISLNLRFDWEKEQATGTATITFAPLADNLRSVEFDAANMTFNSVKLSSGAPLQFAADAPNEKLRITLDRAYKMTDAITVVVDYHTNGIDKGTGIGAFGRGLAFIKPTTDDPKRPRQIWSQGESEYNHLWFPCYDHPNDFATSELIATVDKPLMVISNGRLLETKENADNTRTFHWKMETPHASYLTSIVVGEYAAVEGKYLDIPVISYVYPSELEEGKATTARLPEMVKFFSEKTGLKYPYPKYAQTMTRDFGGGMENISATTQTDNMIHDARTELDQTSDGLQSHELAHQWFGDYVTARTWADIWLNESFATYFQAMWDEHSLGRDDFLYRDVKGNQDAYYGAWERGQRRPIVTKNYNGPDAVFDTYAYPRGGAVLHMLRTALGEDNWWRAINHYLRKYANQPVSTEQFRIAIEEATGQSMDWFFDQWLYKMGHPVFRVTQDYDAAAKAVKLTIRQEQKPDPDSAYPQAGFFQTPVDIELGAGSQTTVTRVQLEPKAEQTITIPFDVKPQLVSFDHGGTLIKELKFEKSTDDLLYQVERDADMLGRLWAMGQLSARLKETATAEADKQRIVAALSTATTSDSFWGIRQDAATALNGAPGDVARKALLAAVKDKNARVRASAVTALSASKDASLASVYLQALNDQSYGVIRAASNALGQTKNAAAYDALTKLLDTPSWRDNIRVSAMNGLAALGDKRSLEMAVRYAAKTNPGPLRAGAITLLSSIGKDDPRVFQLVGDAFSQGLAGSDFNLANTAAEALVVLGDQRGVALFEQALKQTSNPQAQFFIMQFEQRLKQSSTQQTTPKAPGN
ncbi:MAG: aminopeptidase [Blastocatellia bacterium]|jgi:aminopeptidase N|nr:aminopeptidase [Blastocatellia bacterium]